MKIIILDVDEVLRDLMPVVIRDYNYRHGTNFTKEDITDYDCSTVLTKIKNLRKYFYDNAESCFYDALPFKGASSAVKKLQKAGFHIRITTNQFKDLEIFTFHWLRKHKIPYDSVVITSDKSWVQGDYIVDDHAKFVASSPCKHKILMKRMWNKEFWDKFDTISNIDELPKKIKEMEDRECGIKKTF